MNYQFNADGIPNDLKAIPQWTLWKQGIKKRSNGKFPKMPCYELQGTLRKQRGKPKHYTFNEANRIREKHQCGIGIYLGGQLVGADVDGLPQVVSTLDDVPSNIRAVVDKIDTYTEVSQNGKGIHMLSLRSGGIPDWNNRNEETGCELYFKDRYFVVTGQSLNGAHLQTTNMGTFYRKFIKKPKGKQIIFDHSDGQGWPGTNSELVQHLESRMNKSKDIWFGDSFDTKYHSDHSGMDQALFNILAFYLPNQPDRIREVAKLSPWYESLDASHKKKWERDDYIERTIKKAYQDVTSTYKADYGKPEVKEWDGKAAVKGEVSTDYRPDVIKNVEAIVAKMPSVMRALYKDIMVKSQFPQAAFSLFAVIHIFGTIIGRSHMIKRKFANPYIHLLGKTGCGKGLPIDTANYYIDELARTNTYTTNPASAEGLEDAVLNSEAGAVTFILDEEHKQTGERHVALSHFFTKLANPMARLTHRAKSGGAANVNTIHESVKLPFCSVLKASTHTGHHDENSSKEFESGYGTRHLYVCSVNYREENFGDKVGSLPDILPRVRRWSKNFTPKTSEIRHDGGDEPTLLLKNPKNLKYSEEAQQYITETSKKVNVGMQKTSDDSLKNAVGSRHIERIGQLALVFQLAKDPNSTEVNLKSAELGHEIMELHDYMFFKYILPAMPKGPIVDLANKVLRKIIKLQPTKGNKDGLVPWRYVNKNLHLDCKILGQVLDTLKSNDKAEMVFLGNHKAKFMVLKSKTEI